MTKMNTRPDRGTAAADYTGAHAAQYGDKDLRRAAELYEALISSHPSSTEAQYARSQLGNIAKSVVPDDVMVKTLLDLIRRCVDDST